MSKKARSKKNGRKPTKYRVDLTHAEISLLVKVFAYLIDDPPFDREVHEWLFDIEEKILNAPPSH